MGQKGFCGGGGNKIKAFVIQELVICIQLYYNYDKQHTKGEIFMAQATLTARVDEQDKARFDHFCSSVGLNTSTAINLFVKAVLRENRIPFEIAQAPDPFYSEENLAYVQKSVQELRAG